LKNCAGVSRKNFLRARKIFFVSFRFRLGKISFPIFFFLAGPERQFFFSVFAQKVGKRKFFLSDFFPKKAAGMGAQFQKKFIFG